jgi:transcriptional regulator with XRE-family HTH domain
MEKSNFLSENLKAYQMAHSKSLLEFSEELGISKSTIQSIISDGNTTLDTLIRMAKALDASLDELVFGDLPAKQKQLHDLQHFLHEVSCFAKLPPEKQKMFRYHLGELLKLIEYEN